MKHLERLLAIAAVALAAAVGISIVAGRSILSKTDTVSHAASPRKTAGVDVRAQVDLGPAAWIPHEAKAVVIEFSDFECPYCGRYERTTFQQLMTQYVKTGRVAYAVRHFPLPGHRHARLAAEAANCGMSLGRGWEMRDVLFNDQLNLTPDVIVRHAVDIGIDEDGFTQCLHRETHENVDRDQRDGQRLGVRGTPTFFVGRLNDDHKQATLFKRITGMVSLDEMEAAIHSVQATSDAAIAR